MVTGVWFHKLPDHPINLIIIFGIITKGSVKACLVFNETLVHLILKGN